MLAERLLWCLNSLPSRDAERELLEFRARPDVWELCFGIINSPSGTTSDALLVFAAQTLHATARRPTTLAVATSFLSHGLLQTLGGMAAAAPPGQAPSHMGRLLCSALAALGLREPACLTSLLSAALAQLPMPYALQLLLAVGEEGEALQARSGDEVEATAAAQTVLREDLGPHVLSWLASAAAALEQPPHAPHADHGATSSAAQGVRLALVRCTAAWVRLGCLYGAACAAAAVQGLVGALLRGAHPAAAAAAATAALGRGGEASLHHEACTALCDVIEYGPDALLRALQPPMLQLATATGAAAAGGQPRPSSGSSGVSSMHSGAADETMTDVTYDVVQLVASYATARMSELAEACRAVQQQSMPGGGAATPAAAAAEGSALVAALAGLAALPAVTSAGYPVAWPAQQALADLALACLAEEGQAGGARAGDRDEAGDAAAAPTDAMQQDAGPTGTAEGTDGVAGGGLWDDDGPGGGGGPDHCVPDLTLGPWPGLAPPLVHLYDHVLRAVLSCCAAWGMDEDGDHGGRGAPPPAGAGGGSPSVLGAGPCASQQEPRGLLALPPEVQETLATCLQACAGVVGQARQLATAAALLGQAGAPGCGRGTPAAEAGMGSTGPGWASGSGPSIGTAGGVTARVMAAMTAATAAVAACGRLPAAPLAAAGGSGDMQAAEAAASAAAVLLPIARFLGGGEAGSGGGPGPGPGWGNMTQPPSAANSAAALAPLRLHFCLALVGSGRAVLRAAALQSTSSGLAALCSLAHAALSGLASAASAAAAAQALRALTAAAAALGLAPPPSLAERLVDAAQSGAGGGDGNGAGLGSRAAARDLAHAAVAAVRLAAPSEPAPAHAVAAERQRLLERLLAPGLTLLAHAATAAAAGRPWPSLAPSCGAAIARHLRLMETALTALAQPGAAPTGPSLTAPSAGPGAEGLIAGGGAAPPGPAGLVEGEALARVFRGQAWPPLRTLLRHGASGAPLRPLCRCLAALLRAGPLGAAGAGGAASPEQQEAWVAEVVEVLALCMGRPGGKLLHEPFTALLEATEAPGGRGASGGGGGGAAAAAATALSPGLLTWQPQRRRLVVRAVLGVLSAEPAAGMAAAWRSADADPDAAECLLRLAAAAVRHGLAPSGCSSAAAAAAGSEEGVAAADRATAAALATAALRLAAASSGCNHKAVAAAALACTCAALAAVCGPGPGVSAGATLEGVGGADSAAASTAPREVVAAVVQQGPLVVTGLLGALLAPSPLPRLSKVASGLSALGALVALCYGIEQQHQHQRQQHQQLAQQGVRPSLYPHQQAPDAAVGACAGLLAGWLAAAAAALQLPEQEGAALCGSLAPLLAEAGAAAVGGRTGAGLSFGGGVGAAAELEESGAEAAAARVRHRKLWRLLRGVAERRLRA
ncbi:hypothetical protein HYH03_008154 [Edaphochlamys debaryana]|uniref:Uncharacterized protein n=1 Tax=Edaphochlamys debaryana TaxID=47281 RepID=A0A835XYZ8_9CHLO|nr:hypothetical protein HYH03_008154 [Edaphochlamys debaryana]|eukprot:KAG2493637.1 hypothetical protein HYH03_008154 [Edaphochlamys debaryana]